MTFSGSKFVVAFLTNYKKWLSGFTCFGPNCWKLSPPAGQTDRRQLLLSRNLIRDGFQKGNYAKNSIYSNGCTWNCCNYAVFVLHAASVTNGGTVRRKLAGCVSLKLSIYSNSPAKCQRHEEGWSPGRLTNH